MRCQSYTGDGTVSYLPGNDNLYKIDLGDLNLTKPGKYEYNLVGLPTFTVVFVALGFQISTRQNLKASLPLWESKPLTNKVRMVLTNAKGEMVINESAPLNEWVWSGRTDRPEQTFVYRAGKEEEIRIDKTTTKYRRIGVLANGGWGTYIHELHRDGQFNVTVEVQEGKESAEHFEVHLVAQAFTWLLDWP